MLTGRVLSYLRPGRLWGPRKRRADLPGAPFTGSFHRAQRRGEADVNVFADGTRGCSRTDKDYLRQAVCNVRNAIIYAGEAGPIVVEVGEEHGEMRVSNPRQGAGRANKLPLLLEPFWNESVP